MAGAWILEIKTCLRETKDVNCEICGKEIPGKPLIVRIGGAILYACGECAAMRKLAIPVAPTNKQSALRNERRLRKATYAPPKQKTRKAPSELSLKPVNDYGTRVREKRAKSGMAIKDVARLVGIKESLLRKIEGGRIGPSIADLRKLENVMKIRLVEEVAEEEEGFQG